MPRLCWGFLFRDIEIVDLRHENPPPIYQDEAVFVFFKNDMTMEFSELIIFMVIIVLLKNRVEA